MRAGVGEQRHAERLVLRQRHHRERVEHAPARRGRAGSAGPGTFVTTRLKKRWRDIEARGLVHDRRRREAGQVGEHLGAHGLAARLEPLQLLAHDVEPRDRVLAPHRQRRHHRGHAVAERAALHVRAHAHRDHRLQLEAVGVLAAAAQVLAERAGDGGEHDVVDGAAELVLDRLDVGEVRAHPGEAPVRADRLVVGGGGSRVEAGPGHRADAHGGVAQRPRATRRGPRKTARTERASSPGIVARSTSASPSSCAAAGERARQPALAGVGAARRARARCRTAPT